MSAATWKALKSAWESWEPWTAIGWQQPDVIKDILACASREFTRYTPTERSVRDFIDLVDPAITVVVATAELGLHHPALEPLAQKLHPLHPLSDEAFSGAETLLAHATWILIAFLAPELWRDPHSDAHRWLPLDPDGRACLERLTSTQPLVAGPDDADAAAGSSDVGASRRAFRRSFVRDSLKWFAGATAAADRELLEAWDQVLGKAEDLMSSLLCRRSDPQAHQRGPDQDHGPCRGRDDQRDRSHAAAGLGQGAPRTPA